MSLREEEMLKWRENNYPDIKFDDFSPVQLREIRKGFQYGVNALVYAKPDVSYYKMEFMRRDLMKGYDVTPYANSEFDLRQINEIREGIYKKLDVNQYANPNYNASQMKYIREGLENDLDISLYAKFNYSSAFMREFYLALKDNLPVAQLVNDKTSFNKLQIGCNILRAYKDTGLKFAQLKEVAFGLRDEVNIFVLLNQNSVELKCMR